MFFELKLDVIKFIEYSRKCNKGDCTCYKKFKFKFKFSIELFGAITGECILENREDFTYKCFAEEQLIPSVLKRFATRE